MLRRQVNALLRRIDGREADTVGVVERRNDLPSADEAVLRRHIDGDAEGLELFDREFDLVSITGGEQRFAVGGGRIRTSALVKMRLRVLEHHGHRIAAKLGARVFQHGRK